MLELGEVSAKEFFEFKMNSALFFANSSIYERSLGEKVNHVRMMLRENKTKEELDTYLKSIFVTEMQAVSGESFIWEAAKMFDRKLNYVEAVEMVKQQSVSFQNEIDISFPNNTSTESVVTYTTYKKMLLALIDNVSNLKEDKVLESLEVINKYFFKQIKYVNFNPVDVGNYIAEYKKQLASWYMLLGYKSMDELKSVTAFEFFVKNEIEMNKNKNTDQDELL